MKYNLFKFLCSNSNDTKRVKKRRALVLPYTGVRDLPEVSQNYKCVLLKISKMTLTDHFNQFKVRKMITKSTSNLLYFVVNADTFMSCLRKPS